MPLLGIYYSEDDPVKIPYMVMPWMRNGNIRDLVVREIKTLAAIQASLQGMQASVHNWVSVFIGSTLHYHTWVTQLGHICSGLEYLHSEGIVHGDLRGVRTPLLFEEYTFSG